MFSGAGDSTGDGRVIVYYDKRGKAVAVEIADITILRKFDPFSEEIVLRHPSRRVVEAIKPSC